MTPRKGKKPMKVVYIAGPFRADTAWGIECNVRRAEEIGLEVARAGAMPMIPHANTRFFHGECTDQFWVDGTLELLRRCDAVYLLPGWKESEGTCGVGEGVFPDAVRRRGTPWTARRTRRHDPDRPHAADPTGRRPNPRSESNLRPLGVQRRLNTTMSKQELYVYSLDGDRYRGRADDADLGWETREEALTAGREHAGRLAALKDEPPAPVWTGVKVSYEASAFYPSPNDVIYVMHEAATGEVGDEHGEEWPDVDADLHPDDMQPAAAELRTFLEETLYPFLDQWVEKHGLQPKFWSVSDTCKHADDDKELALP